MPSPKRAVITGASSGIGAALARLLSQQGVALGLMARRGDLLDDLVRTLPSPAIALPCDVADATAVSAAVRRGEDALGGPFDLAVAADWTGRLAFEWDNVDHPVGAIHIPACTATGAQTAWFLYRGGYDVVKPDCVSVIVTVNSQRQRVNIGLGAPCPGQAPPT